MILTPQLVRQLTVTKQRLAKPMAENSAEGVLDIFRSLGCIQLDPIRAVERTQYLVLWSRLGNYDRELLHDIQFNQRQVFEYWAHAASIVLTENFPIHQHQMKLAHSKGKGKWMQRVRKWMDENEPFRQYVAEQIRLKGSVLPSDIEDRSLTQWESGGWTSGRNSTQMISFMWDRGEVMVAARKGLQKRWAFADDWFPDWMPREELSENEVVRRAVQIAVKAQGVTTEKQIKYHFLRGYYANLKQVLKDLVAEGILIPVQIIDAEWKGDWYMHTDDLPLVETLRAGAFEGRTVFLSPFDNLICDRARTELLWDFRYRIEIYVPKAKREYGYYVLPILQGERLIGRIAPRMDRKKGILNINGVYAQPDAPHDAETVAAIQTQLHQLAQWLDAKEIRFNPDKPLDWPIRA